MTTPPKQRFGWGLVAIALGLSACSLSSASPDAPPLQTVQQVDIPRYMGRWYEIAKYPNWFQKKCVSDTLADYRAEPDGSVTVLNQCRLASGQMETAIGVAHQTGPATLKVRFAPWWLGWIPAVWGDYWIIDLDPAYEIVAVSEPRRQYLWILSRTPHVNAEQYQALLTRLQAQGFDLQRLERQRP